MGVITKDEVKTTDEGEGKEEEDDVALPLSSLPHTFVAATDVITREGAGRYKEEDKEDEEEEGRSRTDAKGKKKEKKEEG